MIDMALQSEAYRDIEKDLTDLVMNCRELTELESKLSQFNIFRVLRASHNEIRHSNMLAWLLKPDESHSLGSRFLRRWLMQIVHEAEDTTATRLRLPSPIEIDALEIDEVEVARERENIDLLLIIRPIKGAPWIICIENKVGSAQHSDQLRRYRQIVERDFPDAEHRIFVFLTKSEEEPEDSDFLSSSYEIIESVLRICVDERNDQIGSEPKMLVSQYLELLAEDFVGDSKAAQLARQIYKRHRKAIDFILENRKDTISEASRVMEEVLVEYSADLGIQVLPHNKGYIRFIPKRWDVPQNSGGTAWGENSRFVACEVSFWSKKKVELHITIAKAPDDWADKVWARASRPPFKQEWKKRPAQWIKPFKAKSNIVIDTLADAEPEDIKIQLYEWIREELKTDRFNQAVDAIAELLTALGGP
jgi:hypothetical protein